MRVAGLIGAASDKLLVAFTGRAKHSAPEVDQLIGTVRKPALKCFFWTVYSLGLRLQEALHLQVSDIDSGRMLVHVRRGKGHKDRLIPLRPKTLHMLRATGRTHRHPQWLFPCEGRDHRQASTAQRPMGQTTVQDCIKKVVDQLGWAKRGVSTHTLRRFLCVFLAKCFPVEYAAIDWTVEPEWCDKELSPVLGQAGKRNRQVDVLVKVRLLSGQEQWILLHLEIQSS